MDILKRFLGGIAGSKKAIATIATIIFVFLTPVFARLDVVVTPEELQYVIGLAIAYIVGQGVADAGKEKAKIQGAATAALPASAPTTVTVETTADGTATATASTPST